MVHGEPERADAINDQVTGDLAGWQHAPRVVVDM